MERLNSTRHFLFSQTECRAYVQSRARRLPALLDRLWKSNGSLSGTPSHGGCKNRENNSHRVNEYGCQLCSIAQSVSTKQIREEPISWEEPITNNTRHRCMHGQGDRGRSPFITATFKFQNSVSVGIELASSPRARLFRLATRSGGVIISNMISILIILLIVKLILLICSPSIALHSAKRVDHEDVGCHVRYLTIDLPIYIKNLRSPGLLSLLAETSDQPGGCAK